MILILSFVFSLKFLFVNLITIILTILRLSPKNFPVSNFLLKNSQLFIKRKNVSLNKIMSIVVYEGLRLEVDPEVYRPAEDSFLIAENLEIGGNDKVLELGTGSGLLSILAAKRGALEIIATDITDKALKCARKNAKHAGVVKKIEFRKGDLFEPIESKKFDLIIFNPPYLPVPKNESIDLDLEVAWNGGINGRKILDRFIENVDKYLEKDGRFIFVQSSLTGIEETLQKLREKNFKVEKKTDKISFEKLYLIIGEME